MTKTEKRLLGICTALTGSILFVNPQLALITLSVFTGPSSLIKFNPWYYPVPFIGLIIIIVAYGFYHRATPKFRIIIWLLSFLYWSAWVVYFFMDLTPFVESWIIWAPHLAMALASLSGLLNIRRTNTYKAPVCQAQKGPCSGKIHYFFGSLKVAYE